MDDAYNILPSICQANLLAENYYYIRWYQGPCGFYMTRGTHAKEFDGGLAYSIKGKH